ncbi:hypothetical protein [Sphingomonas kyeonggiensis]|uniref:Uncharacterized protein n=1 Tax=Sphingomonas kyeonggiensis TaxID=1268553 RepID=A0A7W6NXB7_9SPHN|nr:hypothetical protein [Sphingomonas kyeonggiensis]MBB4098526.1 hypothetical protein [Sphingomonas kyeonggiensis]
MRDYFRSFFTREYWQALGALLTGVAFIHFQIRDNFWSRVEEEAEERRNKD